MLKIFGLIPKYLYRSRTGHHITEENVLDFNENHSQNDDGIISKNSTVFLSSGLVEKESLELEKIEKTSGINAKTEDSVFLESGLVSNSSKYQFMSEENLIEFVEEPNTVKFTVHEMFVESDDDLISCDQIPVCENSAMKISNLERKFEKSIQQFDEEESDSSSFGFKFKFNSYCSTNEDNQESKNMFREKEDLSSFEGIDFVDDEFMEEEDFSYEVELRPDLIQVPYSSKNDVFVSVRETESNGEAIIEANDHRENIELILEDLDEEFIEFEPQLVSLSDTSKSFSSKDAGNIDELHENENENEKNSWDFDSDDEDEQDALSEHENLVQQMKMELKNCRIGALPTISEECENFKVVEDLRPLNIDQKVEYKDVMEGIQKFYKSYSEKMRKLDILNYQTLHAINDCLKDKKERREEKDAISLDSLVEIVRESMLILKEFLRADKSATNVVLKGILGTKIDRQDTANSELLVNIITTLQKKDRKIREQMRSRNCIVKKLQKQEECRLEREPFTSQVELRLVSRVLALSSYSPQHLNRIGKMVQRLTYRKRHSYATKSNQHRVVKTPGSKLVYQTTKKRASGPKCPVTGKRIQGIPHLRPTEYKRSRLSRNRRTVNRPYGGVLSGGAVRERIIRAFLVEEQKIVKKVVKIQKAKEKLAAKA
ncbi:hypothetical protein RD792_015345 [Penstemon davidsonii]|uniref:60S ribosomal protein L34 n=1 Tax=Penstemon davidsonii TaxID=160366 RepID=A0ABR0CSE5_9LAMI|nr:hypothetical protein RD792_015345 [Penstemon davidsonii]